MRHGRSSARAAITRARAFAQPVAICPDTNLMCPIRERDATVEGFVAH
jgi:hypothetical protein